MIYKLNKTTKSVKFIYLKCPHMAKVIDMVGTISYEAYDNPYVFLVDTIIGQMLSNKVADIMSERLRTLCKRSITPNKIIKLTDNQI